MKICVVAGLFPYAKFGVGYKSGSANASESWLISPYLNISSTSNPQLTFSQAINFTLEDANGTLWIREKDGDWEQVTITYPTRPSSGYSEFVVQSIELSAYKGKTIQKQIDELLDLLNNVFTEFNISSLSLVISARF